MSWDWELFRSVGGPFIGAGLAFLTNNHFQTQKEEAENVSAGNLALHGVVARLQDVYLLRASVRREIERRRAAGSSPPHWALAHRTFLTPSIDDTLDLRPLAFLLGKKVGQEALVKLHLLDVKYKDLVALVNALSLTVLEVHKMMSEIHREHPNEDWPFAEKRLGQELIVRTRDEFYGLLIRVEDDSGFYIETHDLLKRALQEFYGPRIWDLDIEAPEQVHLDSLPPLPSDLLAMLKERQARRKRAPVSIARGGA